MVYQGRVHMLSKDAEWSETGKKTGLKLELQEEEAWLVLEGDSISC